MDEQRLSFAALAKAEPKLQALLEQCQAIVDDKSNDSFCGNAIWCCDIKPKLVKLVGFCRGSKEKTADSKHTFPFANMMTSEEFDALQFEHELPRFVNGIDLESRQAYDLAYDTIYNTLPNCRNCWCL